MSELFYKAIRAVGRAVFRVASDARVLHAERAARPGSYLLAANHRSAYDAPLLIATTPRVIYWLSILEIFRNPLVGWFLRRMGAEPLEREIVDTRTVRKIVRHLKAGRVVGIFPEGGLRSVSDSILSGGEMDHGICRLAQLARVPILPCVVLGGEKFSRSTRWLPGARTRWAVAYGEAVWPSEQPDRVLARTLMAEEMTRAMKALHVELAGHV